MNSNKRITKNNNTSNKNNKPRRNKQIVLSTPPDSFNILLNATFTKTLLTNSASQVINVADIVAASTFPALASTYRKVRVNGYKVTIHFPNTSTTTPGEYVTYLSRDGDPTALMTYDNILKMPSHKETKYYQKQVQVWRPIEPDDYNFEEFSTPETLNYGKIFIGVSQTITDVIPRIDVSMQCTFYQSNKND